MEGGVFFLDEGVGLVLFLTFSFLFVYLLYELGVPCPQSLRWYRRSGAGRPGAS